jgi:hypothetical protein
MSVEKNYLFLKEWTLSGKKLDECAYEDEGVYQKRK